MDTYDVGVRQRSDGTALGVVPLQNPERLGALGALVTRQQPDFDFDVALVGLGYVGLPTALAFHAAGSSVLGLDVSSRRRGDIARCRVDLLDSDHERLRNALQDRAAFEITGEVTELARARAVIVAVPTPVDEHLLPDLSILRSACAQVVENAVPGQLLILTSTTYVGSTSDLLVTPLLNRGFSVGEDIHVAFSPERIDPGNDRHRHEDVPRVVGGVTPACWAEPSPTRTRTAPSSPAPSRRSPPRTGSRPSPWAAPTASTPPRSPRSPDRKELMPR